MFFHAIVVGTPARYGVSMRIDMHAHYVPPRILTALEQDASPYGVRLEDVAVGGRCVHFDDGPVIRPFFPRLLDLEERWGEMARQGLAILMISSELPEILGMSDRIVVMRGGAIAGILDRGEATQQSIMSLALGHEQLVA